MTRTSGQDGIYYGWWVLGTGAVAEILSIGSTSYSAGFFILPLQKEFGLSRASASLPVLILYLGAVCFAPFAGRLMDRYPVRWIASLGALLAVRRLVRSDCRHLFPTLDGAPSVAAGGGRLCAVRADHAAHARGALVLS